MVNYANSKIYKLVGGGLTYIGSTTRPLSERFYEHKIDYKSFKAGKITRGYSSRFVLEHSDACIVLIENCPCENKEQLFARERHWVDTVECVNLYRPKLYEGEAKELQKKHNKEYYEANKEQLNLYNKEYYIANKDKLLSDHKEYRQANKEQLNLKKKLKRQNKRQNKMSL